MAEYVSKYTGDKIDELLGVISQITAEPNEINYIDGATSNIQEQINEIKSDEESVQTQITETNTRIDEANEAINGTYRATALALNRHYRLNNSTTIPWDTGTLICDMNDDGSVFRIQGNAHWESASDSWWKAKWIPGSNNKLAGFKTFKVKEPSDGKIKWVDCCCLHVNKAEPIYVTNLNYNHICIGTDGYVYINIMDGQPDNDNPVIVNFFGIVISVDDSANSGELILGDGSDNGVNDVTGNSPDEVVDGESLPSDIDPLAL